MLSRNTPFASTDLQARRAELRNAASKMVTHGAVWAAGGGVLAVSSAVLAAGTVPLVAGLVGVAVGLTDLGRGAALLSHR